VRGAACIPRAPPRVAYPAPRSSPAVMTCPDNRTPTSVALGERPSEEHVSDVILLVAGHPPAAAAVSAPSARPLKAHCSRDTHASATMSLWRSRLGRSAPRACPLRR